ncbi:hypothetical protein ACHAW5_005707 [Stephanodiscus triporus]|uniref:Uncharacterized protein n=1 Tax=Stephanodiscus triporus TaxID=2934178 RepID=A0ABD3NJJ9_9STRA
MNQLPDFCIKYPRSQAEQKKIATGYEKKSELHNRIECAVTEILGAMATARRSGAVLLVDAPPAMLRAMATAGRRGAPGAGVTDARRGTVLVFDAAATRCHDPCLPDAMGWGGGGGGGGVCVPAV